MKYTTYIKEIFHTLIEKRKLHELLLKMKIILYSKKRNSNNELIGCAIVNEKSIILLVAEEKYRNIGLGTNLVLLGTKYLKDIGLKNASLSYTYTGLDKLYSNTGEIFVLYLDSKYQHQGYGKELIKLNYNDMVIGCISKNLANEFYKHIGGILSSTRPYTKTGDDLQENIYYFKDIKSL